MAKPLFYKSPPRWRIYSCLGAAVLMECAALAVASLHLRNTEHASAPGPLPAVPPVETRFVEELPKSPPPPEVPPPLPPPPTEEQTEFVLEEFVAPPRPRVAPPTRSHGAISSAHAPSNSRLLVRSLRASLTSSPRPPYPYEARRARITGTGQFLLHFDNSGSVTEVKVARSTGSQLLDQVSVNTFRRWRCQPGAYREVSVPISFTLQGAQF